MAKVRTPNQKNKYRELNKRLAKYVLLVEQIYDELNLETAKLVLTTGYDGSKPFRFKDYPNTSDKVFKLKKRFVEELGAVIYSGTSDEWKQSNLVQDLLADRVLKAFGVKHRGKKEKVYYQVNSDALKAFQERKDNGLGLSAKLWNQAANYRQEMEYAISSAVQKGTSAVTLSKRLSKYLQDFPKLQKEYKEKFGKAVECNDCEYRSIRLARSEINMAYRTAEQTRWQQMDFVVGYEIKLSSKHPCHDVCDDLAGKYPKDFKWTGWHPNDMCYLVPILNTDEEFWSDSTTSVNEVKDVPEGFKKWVDKNIYRIEKAEARGTLPYFVKDNKAYVDNIRKNAVIKVLKSNASSLPKDTLKRVEDWEKRGLSYPVVANAVDIIAKEQYNTFTMFEKFVYGQSKIIDGLIDDLKELNKIDGLSASKIKLINEIKGKTAILTRWNLRKADAVSGLSFKGLEKNTTFADKERRLVSKTGEVIDVKPLRRDVLCYEDKLGVKYYYPLGAKAENIVAKAGDVAKYVEELPQKLRGTFGGVLFDLWRHPLDEYYLKEYDGFTYGAMYSQEVISVHQKYSTILSFGRDFMHEIGHRTDLGISNSARWARAVKDDSYYCSRYAMKSLREDYAESFAEAYLGNAMRRQIPHRWVILKQIFSDYGII